MTEDGGATRAVAVVWSHATIEPPSSVDASHSASVAGSTFAAIASAASSPVIVGCVLASCVVACLTDLEHIV